MTTVARTPTLVFSNLANSNPAAVTAVLNNGILTLTGLTESATADITVDAKDMDNNITPYAFTVTVASSAAAPMITANIADPMWLGVPPIPSP